MQFDDYVAARRERLIERAVAGGCPAQEAPALVDAVLADQRRRITRAEDPHPELLAAVDRALVPTAPRRPRRLLRTRVLLLGPVLGAVVLAAVVVALRPDPPPPDPTVPRTRSIASPFGFDADQAERTLESDGFVVRREPTPGCEPYDLVLSTDPPAGTRATEGSTVTVRAARPTGTACLAVYDDRSTAWAFVRWVRGGPAPAFASSIDLAVNGRAPRSVSLGDPVARDPFGRVLYRLAEAFATTAPTADGMPRLLITTGTPPPAQCGTPRPRALGDRTAVRLQLDPTPATDAPCPLTVDLYRSGDNVIDAVAVYAAGVDPGSGG